MFIFKQSHKSALLDVRSHPTLEGNINGPSLIRAPAWIKNPLGAYYLYFAHHEGRSIRLAYADSSEGPWTIHPPGALTLEDSGFVLEAPAPDATHPTVLESIKAGIDGDYPHIASPDVLVNSATQQIRLYFHGRTEDGTQKTRLATSYDGVSFDVLPALLGDSYFRVFNWQDHYYAIAWGSRLYRSNDDGFTFEPGPRLTTDAYRHGAILVRDGTVYVFWSRAGDCPESILVSELLNLDRSWSEWQLGGDTIIHKPTLEWEGAELPLEPSTYGGIMTEVNQLRDPAIYTEDDAIYLLYSIRGEQGIALGKLEPINN